MVMFVLEYLEVEVIQIWDINVLIKE